MVYSRNRTVIWALLLAIIGGLWLRSVVADRHCAGVLDYYFQARAAFRSDPTTESDCTALARVVAERLYDAGATASACGCIPLQHAVEQLSAKLQAARCNDLKTLLWDAKEPLEAGIKQCL